MESAKYLIIGGGIAGTTAASTIRQHDPDGSITILTNESTRLYSRVALPGYTRGKTTRERVFLKDDSFYSEKMIDFQPNTQAISLDVEDKIVTLVNGDRLGYEKLLIATGGRPRTWAVPGADLDGVMPLRTIEQADQTIARLKEAHHVVVVGGGFITLEYIQTLAHLGITATVVIREPYFWGSLLDEESGQLMQSLMDSAPMIQFLYQTEVAEVVGSDKVESVVLSNGRKIVTDLVLANIGIELNSDWLENSGLHLNGGIVTDEFLATNIDDVYAAGDVAMFYDPILNVHHHQGNWNNASTHGRVAGLNMVGQAQPIDALSGYSISFFEKNISFVGQTTTHAAMTVVPRGSAKHGAYGRLLVKDGKLVGATLINRFPDREAINRLIAAQVDVSGHIADLADETVALKDVADKLITTI